MSHLFALVIVGERVPAQGTEAFAAMGAELIVAGVGCGYAGSGESDARRCREARIRAT